MATRKATDGADLVPLNLRMPQALLEALDAEVEAANERDPMRPTNRSDMIRGLLADGIDRLRTARRGVVASAPPAPPAKGKARARKG